MLEASQADLKALDHFKATVGDASHYVCQMYANLGDFHAKRGEFETAMYVNSPIFSPSYDQVILTNWISLYFAQALEGYRAHNCYGAQLAWTLFRQSQAQQDMGDTVTAAASLSEAKLLFADTITGRGQTWEADEITGQQIEEAVPLPSR